MNIPFAKSLELSAAFRYEEFENTDLFNKDAGKSTFDNGGDPAVQHPLSANQGHHPACFLRDIVPVAERVPGLQSASAELPSLFDIAANQTLQPPGGVFQQGTIGLQPETT
jgi:hypothetical protein